MSTQAEVRQRVGEDLGIVPIGQNLEDHDRNRIDIAYTEAYERLKEKGLASWAFSGDVPNKLVPYFCLMIESTLLVSYSVPESRYLRIATEAGPQGSIAMAKLAELTIQEYESTTDATDY